MFGTHRLVHGPALGHLHRQSEESRPPNFSAAPNGQAGGETTRPCHRSRQFTSKSSYEKSRPRQWNAPPVYCALRVRYGNRVSKKQTAAPTAVSTKRMHNLPIALHDTIGEYSNYSEMTALPKSTEDKKRTLARIRRIRGQCEALERALEAGVACGPILQQIAATRGAINGLMGEVLEIYIREEFSSSPPRDAEVGELLALVRSYLK